MDIKMLSVRFQAINCKNWFIKLNSIKNYIFNKNIMKYRENCNDK